MPKLKVGTIVPTVEEDIRIRAGIAQDADTFEATEADFQKMRPVGRPRATVTKERITVRLSPEVTAYFRSLGTGWQTRMDEVLQDYVASKH
jgi:uncharacterized protein (DUF4415 family)